MLPFAASSQRCHPFMTPELFHYIVDIFAVLLGFIATYGQIRSFLSRLFHLSADAAKKWAENRQKTAERYLDNPSWFMAFLARSFVSFIFWAILMSLMRSATPEPGLSPLLSKIAELIPLIPSVMVGMTLGSISSNCSTVITVARKRSRAP